MASSMIHYAISKIISEKINIEHQERFLFGATLVPDASSHDDGSYDQAYFQNLSTDYSKKGIDWSLFEQRYRDNFGIDSIYLGYWCHLVQDSIPGLSKRSVYTKTYNLENKEKLKGYTRC